jgi:hypothetical protein
LGNRCRMAGGPLHRSRHPVATTTFRSQRIR